MTLDERIEVGRQALLNPVSSVPAVLACMLAWLVVAMVACTWWWPLVFACAAVHVACTCVISPAAQRWKAWYLVLTPGVVIALLPVTLRHPCALRRAAMTMAYIPLKKDQHWLTERRLVPQGMVMDLATGSIVGSYHAQMDERARRTRQTACSIMALQNHCPEGIVVSDRRRQVLIDAKGAVLAIQKIREDVS